MTSFADHLNTVRDVLNMAEVPYVDDFYRALAALDAIEVAWNSAYDLPTPRLIAEVERLRAELAAAHEALQRLASTGGFIGALDAAHAPPDVLWAELRARGEYASSAALAASGGEE